MPCDQSRYRELADQQVNADEFLVAEYAAGNVIFNIGDDANVLYVVQEGSVLLTDSSGDEFSEIHAGEAFGEQALLSGGIRGAGARAKTPVKCFCITTQRMAAYLLSYSPLLALVLEGLLLELSMKNSLQAQINAIARDETLL